MYQKRDNKKVASDYLYDDSIDKYYSDIEELLDDYYDRYDDTELEYIPNFVYYCTEEPCINLSYNFIIERYIQYYGEELPEDFDDYTIKGEEEFKKAIDAFNEVNKHKIMLWPDKTRRYEISDELKKEYIKDRKELEGEYPQINFENDPTYVYEPY